MKIKRALKIKLLYIAVFILLAVTLLSGGFTVPAFADYTVDTNVLDDLRQDKSFDVFRYSVKPNDYSLEVIQIAESTSGELFIYVYQPCAQSPKLNATSLNMSASKDTSETGLYYLEYINSKSTLYKYKVKDFKVQDEVKRYYNITSIYREWIEADGGTGNSNTEDDKAFKVGQLWTATTLGGGEVNYDVQIIDTVTITDKYVGYLDYPRGFGLLYDRHCYSHYVAFSTDHKMNTLDEVEIAFVVQPKPVYSQWPFPDVNYKEDPIDYTLVWTSDDYANNAPLGLFGKLHEEKRIQSSEDFIASENLTEEGLSAVRGKQWVLRFFETAYTTTTQNGGTLTYKAEVSKVTILRLKFTKDGVSYNLGVVDSKSTPDPTAPPDNDPEDPFPEEKMGFWEYIWHCIKQLFTGKASIKETIIAIAVIVVLVAILPIIMLILSLIFPAFRAVLTAVFKGLWWLIKMLFKGLWLLVTLPFRLISKAIKNRKAKK